MFSFLNIQAGTQLLTELVVVYFYCYYFSVMVETLNILSFVGHIALSKQQNSGKATVKNSK